LERYPSVIRRSLAWWHGNDSKTDGAVEGRSSSWWRGGGGSETNSTDAYQLVSGHKKMGLLSSSHKPSLVTTDVSGRHPYATIMLDEYPVSACSVQGYRQHMQDEFVVQSDFIGCFDGHGGHAVARYLRQNLYAHLQATLPQLVPRGRLRTTTRTTTTAHNETAVTQDDTKSTVENAKHATEPMTDTIPAAFSEPHSLDAALADTTADTASPPTVSDYEAALAMALRKVDTEVHKIQHWSFQGSTAVACWFHTTFDEDGGDDESLNATKESDGSNNGTLAATNTSDEPDALLTTNATVDEQSPTLQPPSPPQQRHRRRTIVTANVGDSRAILCRNGTALELTRDHKPSDPYENERIHSLGGLVVWSGQIDRHGQPIIGTGQFRIQNGLSLSRAIGDLSERPIVSGEPEISIVSLVDDDEFLVLASDGLWDVMSSADTVAYIRALRHEAMDDAAMERDSIAALVVEEALRRGSSDNITVLIVWIQKTGPQRPKTYWI
jgi:serine/threonine protein phosphatase PrpC